MKLLAWDTSSKSGAIAALEWDEGSQAGRMGLRLVSEWALSVQAQHSERLLWGIHQTLEAARWKLSDLDVLGVGVGPGSFTGLRIGLTTARTLSQALRKPLIGVSSLAALARPAALWTAENKEPALIVATTDAAKGELFTLYGAAKAVRDCASMADGDFPGLWKRGVEERVMPPDALAKALKKKLAESKMRWLAIGEGRSRYPELWDSLPKKRELVMDVPFSDQVQGRYVATLAWEAYQAGLARDALSVHPRYLRVADAQLKLEAGLLNKNAPTRGLDDINVGNGQVGHA